MHAVLLAAAVLVAIAIELARGDGLPADTEPALVEAFRGGRSLAGVLFALIYASVAAFVLLGGRVPPTHALLWMPALAAVTMAVACAVAAGLAATSGHLDAGFEGALSLVPTVAVLMSILPLLVPVDLLAQLPADALRAYRRRAKPSRDDATGLRERAVIEAIVAAELDRARRYGRPLSVVLLDVDGLSALPAAHGRAAVDEVLARIGEMLPALSREVDRIGRWEASEFVVVLPETPRDAATIYAQRLCWAVADLGYAFARRFPGPALTASVGYATASEDDVSAEAFLRKVETARARAKAAGGNTCHLWEEGPAS